MGIFRKNEKWYIDYYFQGKRVRECVGTNKTLAKRALEARKGEIVQGRFKLENLARSPQFDEVAKEFLAWSRANRRSWKRDEQLVGHLLKEFSGRKLNDIHPFLIESYKIKRKEEVKPATVNREVACLKRIFNLAIKWGMTTENPVRAVKLFPEPKLSCRWLSHEEGRNLIDACATHLKAIVVTALNTGMRLQEILKLKWEHVNVQQRYLTVVAAKNNENREIPLNREMISLLTSLERESEYVFPNDNGQPFGSVKTAFNAAVRRSGIQRCRFHDLRHTFASHSVMNGVDLTTVKELLGHKSLAMVLRYAHLSAEHKRRAVESLDGTFSLAPDGHYLDTALFREIKMSAVSG